MRLLEDHRSEERPIVTDPAEIEALIREARRLRRRRWAIGSVAVLVAGAGLSVGLGLASGGGTAGPVAGRTSTGPAPTAPATIARWSELTTPSGGLPGGSQITSVIGYDGRSLAAGELYGDAVPATMATRCPEGCNPAVWTSTDGRRWTLALGVAARGSSPGEQLVVTPSGLLLFQTDESTSLWRSTDGRSRQQVRLPPKMAALGAVGASYGHGRVVVVLANKFAGGPDAAYGEADTIWTSTNGTIWQEDTVSGAPSFDSLTATASGFLAGGSSRSTGRSTVWQSTNGHTWVATAIGTRKGTTLVAAHGDTDVAEITGGRGTASRVQLWWSTGGGSWRRAAVRGGPITTPSSYVGPLPGPLAMTASGFAVAGGSLTGLWSSTTGRVWTPLKAQGLPPATATVQGLFADGSGLLAVATTTDPHVSERALTTSLWRVTVTRAS